MPMDIIDAEARVNPLLLRFFERLEYIGCENFPTENPKKTVQLLLHRMHPQLLKAEMKKSVQFDESLIIDVKNLIRFLTVDEKICQVYGTIITSKGSGGGPRTS